MSIVFTIIGVAMILRGVYGMKQMSRERF